MEAIEFVTKIKDNQILVPAAMQSVLEINKDKEIRVIVLIEEEDAVNGHRDDSFFQKTAKEQFLKGYADSDSIYDNF